MMLLGGPVWGKENHPVSGSELWKRLGGRTAAGAGAQGRGRLGFLVFYLPGQEMEKKPPLSPSHLPNTRRQKSLSFTL